MYCRWKRSKISAGASNANLEANTQTRMALGEELRPAARRRPLQYFFEYPEPEVIDGPVEGDGAFLLPGLKLCP